MKRHSSAALLLAALLLLNGILLPAGAFADDSVPVPIDSSYYNPAPAGIQPLAARAGEKNTFSAPDETKIIRAGSVSFVSNELLLVTGNNTSEAEIKDLAAGYGFSVVGYIEPAGAAQLRSGSVYTLAELETLAGNLSRESGVLCAVPHYVRKLVSLQTSSGTNGSDGSWGQTAINADWHWAVFPDLPYVTVGVIDTMFDVNHKDVTFAQLLHSDIYYDTEKTAGTAVYGTFSAGLIAANHDESGVSGVMKHCTLVGSSLYGVAEESSCLTELSLIAELLSYGLKIVDFPMGYGTDTALLLAAGDTVATAAYTAEKEFFSAALGNIIKNNWDFLLVCGAGDTSSDAALVNAFAGITEETIAARVLVVGSAEKLGEESYAVSAGSGTGSRVDVYAPGSGVESCSNRNGYVFGGGTGVAASYAAGAAGAILASRSKFDCAKLKTWITDTADIPVSGTDKLMINLRAAEETVTFSSVDWEYYDNIDVHPLAPEYNEPKVHVLAADDKIEFKGYNVSAMDAGVRYSIAPTVDFEIECDIDTSTIKEHPGGYLEIVLGPISAQLSERGGSILVEGRSVSTVSSKFHLKMSLTHGGQYEVEINGATVSSLNKPSDDNVQVRFGFVHDSHYCEQRSDAYITGISMHIGRSFH